MKSEGRTRLLDILVLTSRSATLPLLRATDHSVTLTLGQLASDRFGDLGRGCSLDVKRKWKAMEPPTRLPLRGLTQGTIAF